MWCVVFRAERVPYLELNAEYRDYRRIVAIEMQRHSSFKDIQEQLFSAQPVDRKMFCAIFCTVFACFSAIS